MRMLRAKEAAAIIGFSLTVFYEKVAEGMIPEGKKVGSARRWADYLIEAYTILYWDLDKELPPLSERERAIINQCLENVKAVL